MTKPKDKQPITSFGPELMAFLIKAGQEKVVLVFDGEGGKTTASAFRHRVHTLRRRMREDAHPDHAIAARAKLSLLFGDDAVGHGAPEAWRSDPDGKRGAIILGRPQDMEFTSVLKDAGIELEPSIPATPTPIVPEPGKPSMLDDIFSDDFAVKK